MRQSEQIVNELIQAGLERQLTDAETESLLYYVNTMSDLIDEDKKKFMSNNPQLPKLEE